MAQNNVKNFSQLTLDISELTSREFRAIGDAFGIETYIEKGDNYKDNRHTPEEYLKATIETLGEIDLDPFASLEKRTPAKKHYTVVEDAFNPANKWSGKLFINPPFSQFKKVLIYLNNAISQGHTTKGVMISPSTILCSKGGQKFFEVSNAIILAPKGRISFAPGTYLRHVEPNATTNSNRQDCVISCWGDRETKKKFCQAFGQYGHIWRRE